MALRLGLYGLAFYYESPRKPQVESRGLRILTAGPKGADIIVSNFSEARRETKIVLGVTQALRHSDYKELSRKGTAICFPFAELISAHNRFAAIEKIIRNIKLCRKHHASIAIATFSQDPYIMRSPMELKGLFLTLGMDTKQVKAALGVVWGIFDK